MVLEAVHTREKVLKGARNNAPVFILGIKFCFVVFFVLLQLVLGTTHRVSFSCSSLAVSEDGGVVALHDVFNEVLATLVVNGFLVRTVIVHVVKGENVLASLLIVSEI